MAYRDPSGEGCWVGILLIVATIIASVAGWITHIVVCIQSGNWLLLIGGAIGAPIGIIHGWGCWFGWWG